MYKWLIIFFSSVLLGHAQEPIETQTEIYHSPFLQGDKIGSEWKLHPAPDCKPAIETSPNGKRTFLGKIPVGKQSLKLSKLPAHSHIRVQFDLIIRGTWDGDHKEWGPDIWKFDIDGRQPLVNSTFCNQVANKRQSFPDFINDGYSPNRYFTGAFESAKLGYMWRHRQADPEISVDSTYRFNFLIPHHQKTLQLNFESTFHDVEGEPNRDQWYGIDNLKITTVTNPTQLSDKAAKKAIINLTSHDPLERRNARVSLLASDQSFIQALKSRLKNTDSIDLSHTIAKLNHDSYEIREAATKEMLSHNAKHYQTIVQALDLATEPEIIARLKFIIKEGKKRNKQTTYTEIRRLLKTLDTPAAKLILKNKALSSL